MLGLFSSAKKKKEEQMIRELHGMAIKYAAERKDGEETIIGRGGSLSVRGDELIVFSSGEIVFRADVRTLSVSSLLSGDGAIIQGPDKTQGGARRCVVAYYVYHRK